MGKRIYCSCHPTWLPCKTSFSRRVYVKSLCYEYQNSFILKFEPFTITKIWHWDLLWKRDIEETFSCGLLKSLLLIWVCEILPKNRKENCKSKRLSIQVPRPIRSFMRGVAGWSCSPHNLIYSIRLTCMFSNLSQDSLANRGHIIRYLWLISISGITLILA